MELILADIDAHRGNCRIGLVGHGSAPSQCSPSVIAGKVGARPDHSISGDAAAPAGRRLRCGPAAVMAKDVKLETSGVGREGSALTPLTRAGRATNGRNEQKEDELWYEQTKRG
jgi:hypothetical protein